MKKVFIIIGLAILSGLLIKTQTFREAKQPEPNSPSFKKKEKISNFTTNKSKEVKENVLEKYQTLVLCYETQDCDFPNSDAREYDYSIGQAIKELFIKTNGLDIPDKEKENLLKALADQGINSYDGYVQAEALKIYSSLPIDRENLAKILSGLSQSNDPLLIEYAMKEFERYIGQPEEVDIAAFLSTLFQEGGQFSSEKASTLILSFINERTLAIYEQAATQIPETSRPGIYLRKALNEYYRIQSAG
ncbi:MAG: hypothetical protein M9962_00030 [Oligoflexia bacterium]|nr:hypothetical protein [Oligoflexia bacterium]